MNKLAIHGAPRSGTTWLGEIINSSSYVVYKFQPLFSYKFKGFLGNCSTSEQICEFFELLCKTSDSFCDQIPARSSGELPNFQKTGVPKILAYKEVRYHNILNNLARREKNLKFIFIIRDPMEVLASWFRAPREFRSDLGWSFPEEWRYATKKNLNNPENFFGFEKWKESALLFLNLKSAYPDRVEVLNYSELRENSLIHTQRIFKYLDIPLEKQTIDFLGTASSKHSKTEYGVFPIQNRSEKFILNNFPSIHDEIVADLKGGLLERFLCP